MKRIRSILRGREGMTLVELEVGAGVWSSAYSVRRCGRRPRYRAVRRS